ncbi:twin-arginine translocase TatA/TatE family subunit [Desulfocicer niacini]
MFGLGMPEIFLILAIALMVIGPKKLPDVAKTLGRAMGEFKKAAQDFKKSMDVESTINEFKEPAITVADDLKKAADVINPLSTQADGTPLEKAKAPESSVPGTADSEKKTERKTVEASLDPFPAKEVPLSGDLSADDDTPPMKQNKDEKGI